MVRECDVTIQQFASDSHDVGNVPGKIACFRFKVHSGIKSSDWSIISLQFSNGGVPPTLPVSDTRMLEYARINNMSKLNAECTHRLSISSVVC